MDVGGEALPPGVDEGQEATGGGQGAVALPGTGHGVGADALELHKIAPQAEHVHVGDAGGAAPAVDHGGQGQAVEGAVGGHAQLGAGLLLGGGAEDVYRALELVLDVGQGQGGQNGHGAVGVVPAGVAQAGESVVLHQDGGGGTLAIFQHAPEGGGVAHVGVLHLVTGLAEEVHHLLAGAELLVGQLGVGIQVVAEGDGGLPVALDGLGEGVRDHGISSFLV